MIARLVVFFHLSGILLLLVICMPQSIAASDDLKPQKLIVAFIQRAFLGVNPLDVEAAYKTFVRTVGHDYGYDLDAVTRRFESSQDLEAIPAADRPFLIILDSWSYLELSDSQWLEPLFVTFDPPLFAADSTG
jgi:hypothetical protein